MTAIEEHGRIVLCSFRYLTAEQVNNDEFYPYCSSVRWD